VAGGEARAQLGRSCWGAAEPPACEQLSCAAQLSPGVRYLRVAGTWATTASRTSSPPWRSSPPLRASTSCAASCRCDGRRASHARSLLAPLGPIPVRQLAMRSVRHRRPHVCGFVLPLLPLCSPRLVLRAGAQAEEAARYNSPEAMAARETAAAAEAAAAAAAAATPLHDDNEWGIEVVSRGLCVICCVVLHAVFADAAGTLGHRGGEPAGGDSPLRLAEGGCGGVSPHSAGAAEPLSVWPS
jgi:hypothetical protein